MMINDITGLQEDKMDKKRQVLFSEIETRLIVTILVKDLGYSRDEIEAKGGDILEGIDVDSVALV